MFNNKTINNSDRLMIELSKSPTDQDENWHSIGSDLGLNCLQRLSAEDKSHC